MKMNYTRDRKRVDYFEQAARTAAGLPPKKDDTGTPTGNGLKDARRRKVKIPMVAGSDSSGTLELIVEGDGVYIVGHVISRWDEKLTIKATRRWNT